MKLSYIKMKAIIAINILLIMISLINTKVTYQLFSHSGGWCDYDTKLGRVNIQVQILDEDPNKEHSPATFFMILKDNSQKEYKASCKINLTDKVETTFCFYEPPNGSYDLFYKEGSLIKTEGEDDIVVRDDFKIMAQGCEGNGQIIDWPDNKPSNIITDELTDEVTFTTDDLVNETNKTIPGDKSNINLSFRQINFFQIINYEIIFNFYALTTQKLEKGTEIVIFLYLILGNGELDQTLSKAICTLDQDVDPAGGQAQADFKCTISDLDKTKEYKSFEISDSDDIAGIPENKTLLDPVKTAEAINSGAIIDFSVEENKAKLPTILKPESINGDKCSEEGKFVIIGNINNEIESDIEFQIPLAHPESNFAKCTIAKSAPGPIEVNCEVDKGFSGQPIIIEQQVLRDGLKELLTLESTKSKGVLNCKLGEEKPTDKVITEEEAEKKLNIQMAFRQVNHFIYSPRDDAITFNFIGLSTEKLEKGTEIIIYLYLILGHGERDTTLSEATCTLEQGVDPAGGQAQADFKCTIGGLDETKEYESVEISDSESIAGIPEDKTLLDPIKTRDAIELGQLLDYSLEENKSKLPVIFNTESINGEKCVEDAEFKIVGSADKEIETDLEFIIYLTYPSDNFAKCSISKAGPGKMEINCIMAHEVSGESIMFEQQVLRNGLKDFLTFKSVKSDKELNCASGNITESDIPTINYDEEHAISHGSSIESEEISNNTSIESNDTSSEINNDSTNQLIDLNGTDIYNNKSIEETTDGTDIDNNTITEGTDIDNNTITDETDIDNNTTTDIDNNTTTDKQTTDGTDTDNNTTTDEQTSKNYTLIYEGLDNEEIVIVQEAIERANLAISFRQLNKFTYSSGTITFMFFGLITDFLKQGFEIKIFVNLIKISGEREDEAKEIICSLSDDISPPEGQSLQGSFKCTKSGLEEEYYSLRFNSSDQIAGVPDDETLLDPVLTDEAIAKKELLDYSDAKNQNKIPATFTPTVVQEASCKTDGKFTIEGTLNKESTNDVKFTIPLTYPEGMSAACSLEKKEAGNSQISCQIDRELVDKGLIFEQVVIKDGPDEIFILGGLASDNKISCKNGLLAEAEERTNIQISFRQVSHLIDNGNNGFSFFFASFISTKLQAGYSLVIKIKVLIGEDKKEKTAKCTLQSDVEPQDGQQVQGDFKCEATLEEEEYKQIDLNQADTIKISTDNEEIAGVSDLEEDQLSPKQTDLYIQETNENINKENLTELEECVDYSIEENKQEMPPSFEVTTIENIQECGEKGKFRIKGKFSSEIKKEMVFDLPLSFPTTSVKCKVNEASANEEVELTCKVQKHFKLVKNFVIEKRMIKRRFKETLLVKSKSFPINEIESLECENFNVIKYERAKRKQKLDFSFLQLGKFQPQGRKVGFFMGLIRKNRAPFVQMHFTIKVIVTISNNLRSLAGNNNSEDLQVTCEPKTSTSIAGGLDCSSDKEAQGTPTGMELDPANIEIGGLPNEIDPSKITNSVDYSKKENLEKIDQLPVVDIEKIDSDSCEEDGKYTITGTFDSGTLEDATGVEIPFGSPDSSGLCDIKVSGKSVTMECNNKEKFGKSSILFEQTVIKNSNGEEIFILSNYTNQKSFGCAISGKSETSTSKAYNRAIRKTNSSGLSGGAIAGIIIACIAIVAIVLGLILLTKKGTFSSKAPMEHLGNNSTLNSLSIKSP